MAKRKSNRKPKHDTATAGNSELVPHIKGEDSKVRHARRLELNLEAVEQVRAWCLTVAMQFRVENSGHHWKFSMEGFCADWWPSSAKLVINKKWSEGIHCHDWMQLIRVLTEELL